MRLFYDVYTSRLRAEILLLAADTLAIATGFLYATGAVRSGASAEDVALLLVWACLPRSLAKLLGSVELPVRHARTVGLSAILVGLTVLLVFAGWDLLDATKPPGESMDPALTTVLLCTWASGFFLFHPRAYRLHDFLLLSVILFGLKLARPYPWAWLPTFLSGLYLSSAVRHLLNDAFRGLRSARYNLQNARAISVLVMGATIILFLGVYTVLNGGLEFPDRRAIEARMSDRLKASLVGDVEGKRTAGRGATGRDGAKVDGTSGSDPSRDARRGRVAGFSYRIGLKDLAFARFDSRVVLRIRDTVDESWRPEPGLLWKGVSFSTFDPGLESWEEEVEYRVAHWPQGGLRLPQAPSVSGRRRILRHEVVLPVFRNLVSPYVTLAFPGNRFAMFRENSLGDVFPSALSTGTVYDAEVVPIDVGSIPASPAPGTHPDARYLKLPPQRELGFDIVRFADEIFRGAGPGPRDRVMALREAYVERGFRYSNNALWRTGSRRLRKFLVDERVGDCTYYSTSTALLLRAGGVSTRLTVGFNGATWDAESRAAVIRNQQAHAWAEAYFPGHGWYPVDATAWVPTDPSYVPPPDALNDLRAIARTPGGAHLRLPGDPRLLRDGLTPPGRGDLPPGTSTGGRDFVDGSRTVEDGTRIVTSRDLVEDDDIGAWVQYDGGFDPGEEVAVEEVDTAPLQPGMASARARTEDDRRGVGPIQIEATVPGNRPSRSGAMKLALRAALALIASFVLFLVVKAFMRPKAAEDEREEEKEAEEPAGALSAFAAGAEISVDTTNPRERILWEYVRLQADLQRTRNHRLPHQTPLEHSKRILREQPVLEKAFIALHRILYRIVYGGADADEDQADLAARSCRRIRRVLG